MVGGISMTVNNSRVRWPRIRARAGASADDERPPAPPRSILAGHDTATEGGSCGGVRGCAVAAGLAAAAIGMPTVAHAKPPQPPATAIAAPAPHWTTRVNPNVVQLPPAAQEAVDNAFAAVSNEIQAVDRMFTELMRDEWSVEDAWLIVAWNLIVSKGRRRLWDLVRTMRRKKETPDDDGEEDKAAVEAAWNASVLNWLRLPARTLLGVWCWLYAWDVGSKLFAFPTHLGAAMDIGAYTMGFAMIQCMFINRYGPVILERYSNVKHWSVRVVITRAVTVGVLLAATLKTLVLFNMPTSSIIGASSVAGLAISLAMKDTLQNVFGGTFLAILRPFAEGEEIYILPSGQFRGSADPNVANYKVQNVGWYYTTLIPKDTMPVTVPNGYFIGANVINVTRAVARVIYFDVRLLFSDRDKIPAIRDEVTAFLTNNPRVNSRDFPVRVNLTAVKEDHLVMSVEHHVYKKPLTEHLAMKQDLMMDVMDIIESNTSGRAYPTEIMLTHPMGGYPGAGDVAKPPVEAQFAPVGVYQVPP